MNRRPIYVLLLLAASVRPAPAASRPPIGTNLNGLSYYSTELPFLDSFKSVSEWVSSTEQTWDDKRPLDLDSHGWVRSLKPGQLAYAVLFHGFDKFPGLLPARLVVTYEGKGEIRYEERASLVEHGDHRDVIAIDASQDGNATLAIAKTDPKDYIRNIRIVAEGAQAKPGELFNPIFIERLKGYRALRFGIWMMGESAGDVKVRAGRWTRRPTLQDPQWSQKGVPAEAMVALSNKVHADPWFNIAYNVDDDYVRRFAQLVAKSLDPKLKVYLEYDNEVWNDQFEGTKHARKQGLALGLSQDPNEALLRFYAKRAVEIFTIFETVLGKERLVRVLAFQSEVDPQWSDEIALSYGDTSRHVDALAIAPYFGTELANEESARTKKMTLDEFMKELETSSLPKTKAYMLAHAAVAKKYGLKYIAYEGGQHLWNFGGSNDDPELNNLFNAANKDPRMGKIYSRYLQDWADAGGGLFMHELDCGSFPDAGNWGALEYITQPRAEAPTFDALQRFMEGHP